MKGFNFRALVPTTTGWLALAAIAAGLLAMAASQRYLDGRESALRESLAGTQRTRPVVVAAHALRAGEVLVQADLAAREVPTRFAPSDSLDPAVAAQLLGRRLLRSRSGGDTLSLADVESTARSALAARLPEGWRALTIAVDELGSLAGLLRAGDRIDLYYQPQAGGEGARIGLLLPSVLVLATDQDTQAVGSGTVAAAHAGYSTITLQLAPEDAARVALAQRAGQLTAVLRGSADQGSTPATVRSARTLFATPVRHGAAHRLPVSIELIAGGRGSLVAEGGQLRVPAPDVGPGQRE